MKLEGTVQIDAPREKVWSRLIDPAVVSECAPGLKSLQIITPDKLFKVVVGVGFGSVKVTFDVDVEWLELNAPASASLKAHGSGQGSAVDVTSAMELRALSEASSELAWSADVVVVGTIASMASRMLGGLTKKLTASFFDCFKTKLEETANVQA